jgi:hypothetical protein
VVILSYCVGVEAHFEFEFFLRFECSLGNFNIENTVLFYLIILQMPVDIFLIDIADCHSDKLRIASVRFGHYFSLEVDD